MALARTFFITTMGCQMNEYDSDFLAQSLLNFGLSPVKDPQKADLILINTCTVRAKPEQKAYSLLGRMSAIKSKKPGTIIGVVGCLAQQQGPDLMKSFPQLDLVLGPRQIGGIEKILKRMCSFGEKVVATDLESITSRSLPCNGYFRGRVTGYISIMEGCNNFCSYCIVPFVRGRETSRPPDEILAEAQKLISQGVREITLLGQNVNSYLWKGGQLWSFPALLREFNKLTGLFRLRFTTSHPKNLSNDLISCFGELSTLCPHIHLPFQAGSNSVLEAMHRGYTRDNYLELIAKLRQISPDIAITSDVMVGFPGESRDDFEQTLDLIKAIEFDTLFSFKYSDRKGTFAVKMGGKVEESEKAWRLSTLQALQKQITRNKNRALEGRKFKVLVEGHSKKGGQLAGRTGTNRIVNFTGDTNKIGSLVNVRITHGFVNSLRGEIDPSGSARS